MDGYGQPFALVSLNLLLNAKISSYDGGTPRVAWRTSLELRLATVVALGSIPPCISERGDAARTSEESGRECLLVASSNELHLTLSIFCSKLELPVEAWQFEEEAAATRNGLTWARRKLVRLFYGIRMRESVSRGHQDARC